MMYKTLSKLIRRHKMTSSKGDENICVTLKKIIPRTLLPRFHVPFWLYHIFVS